MRKRIIFSMLISVCVTSAYAQLLKDMDHLFGNSNQSLIEEAVADGLLIVSQEYQLQDVTNKNLFGRDKKEYFEKTYSLAVRLNGGYLLTNTTVKPWETDKNFDEYRNNEKYIPLISKTTFRKIADKKFAALPFDTAYCAETVPGYLYTLTDTKGEFGFQLDRTAGLKKGWLVWVKLKDDISASDTTGVELQIYRNEITVKPDSLLYEVKSIAESDHLLGGIYVVPEVTRVGQLTFKLVGMLRNIDNKWNVLTFGSASDKASELELTPVKKDENSDSTTL